MSVDASSVDVYAVRFDAYAVKGGVVYPPRRTVRYSPALRGTLAYRTLFSIAYGTACRYSVLKQGDQTQNVR